MSVCSDFAALERREAEKRAAKEAAQKREQDLAEQKLAEEYFNTFESKESDPIVNTEAAKTEHVTHGVLHENAEAHFG